ncbi:TetR/AcrR family transcriptional regulator [Sanguibacter sp. HDW7]|uniref:TetR/AcrR family transcriptional regulator n=1 Tax=Sanguibacter sp. HDW7 TaxID=2714931 RepID=UPI00140C5100|nr:TetR/AcrR family transcriptional regulator [Sanguibacter sp. HDW7]QIK84068.1 TetR/AcrR family transcriptional regulator [Sanguibacter sp. HDW7]
MERTEPATRDKARTRRAIIDAAATMIAARGSGVSLADIAKEAGVSKGALTHHFASKNELEDALLADIAERLRAEVHAHVDPSENRPGMLLRGYIRAMTSDSAVVRDLYSPTAYLLMLGMDQPIGALLERDAAEWRAEFAADGIDEATSLVLRLAAEGLAASHETPYVTAGERALARARLLELAG